MTASIAGQFPFDPDRRGSLTRNLSPSTRCSQERRTGKPREQLDYQAGPPHCDGFDELVADLWGELLTKLFRTDDRRRHFADTFWLIHLAVDPPPENPELGDDGSEKQDGSCNEAADHPESTGISLV
ncbi:MAG: hypothetical protein ACKVHU_06260 [Acidimicrobiales bacterium]|jgi:hypothetical protein